MAKTGFTPLEIVKQMGLKKRDVIICRERKFLTGFTLVELIMVIVILGLLAAVAIPNFVNLQTQAKAAAEAGVVGGVRSGIAIYRANKCATTGCAWPTSLDSAGNGDCNTNNPCFTTVLSQGGITSDWSKMIDEGGTIYRGPAGGVYRYASTDGSFK